MQCEVCGKKEATTSYAIQGESMAVCPSCRSAIRQSAGANDGVRRLELRTRLGVAVAGMSAAILAMGIGFTVAGIPEAMPSIPAGLIGVIAAVRVQVRATRAKEMILTYVSEQHRREYLREEQEYEES